MRRKPHGRKRGAIGIFGGTFDPIHLGHLILAELAAGELGLERVLFVPASRQPLKNEAPVASGADRLAMVRAAIRGNPRFAADDRELRRRGTSYTIDTVRSLRRETAAPLFLLCGADAFATLAEWKAAEELASAVTFAVMARPGAPPPAPPAWVVSWALLEAPLLDLSSRDLRVRIGAGKPVRYFVPDAVLSIIGRRGLYRTS